jgi:hypothetical protein
MSSLSLLLLVSLSSSSALLTAVLLILLVLLVRAYKLHGTEREPTGLYRFSTRRDAAAACVPWLKMSKAPYFHGNPLQLRNSFHMNSLYAINEP